MNLPEDAVLAYSFEPEARYWAAVTAHDPGFLPDIVVSARVPGDGCYWEIVIEDDGTGSPGFSRYSDPGSVAEAREQVPEFFAVMAELRPCDLEGVRAVLVSLGAEDVTIRKDR